MITSRSRPGNGGKREGAGRKPGASTQLTRYEITKVAKSGKAPADIMLKNMWWWDEQADLLQAQIVESLKDVKLIEDDDQKLDELGKLKKKFDAFVHARDKAQSCAVDAAPYIHARLQSIAIRPESKGKMIVKTTVPTMGAVDDKTRSYRDGYDAVNVLPIRKTNGNGAA